jgi:hypothetical protein
MTVLLICQNICLFYYYCTDYKIKKNCILLKIPPFLFTYFSEEGSLC